MKVLRPKSLSPGDTIGICTPSSPSYIYNEELFLNGVKNLKEMGFKVKLGDLTMRRSSQGYRSGSAVDRAREFMDLVKDESVNAIMSTIGGNNSSSLIPYLDFELIREKRKIFCGYSDVTSLHLAIYKYAGLKTLYGPALMTWFGEYPRGIEENIESFKKAISADTTYPRKIIPFTRWSNHRRDWSNGDWKNIDREWNAHEGWTILSSGEAVAELITCNLNTLVSNAGTPHFPDLKDKILLIEEMDAPYATEERNFRQLQLMGVFDEIIGLIIGRPEVPDHQGAPFSLDDLIVEIIGKRDYPIINNFDCSHTLPMYTLGMGSKISFKVINNEVEIKLLESFVD